MNGTTIALCLAVVAFLSGGQGLSQDLKGERDKTGLSARIEVDTHQHCFTVRFFLKNGGKDEVEVVYGRGSSGLSVAPQFRVGSVTITPPTYLRPPRRSGAPDRKRVPAGQEILYGTFTMGYPPVEEERDEKLTAIIRFRELKATLQTEPQTLKIPALKRPK